jgi:hypothetical protein
MKLFAVLSIVFIPIYLLLFFEFLPYEWVMQHEVHMKVSKILIHFIQSLALIAIFFGRFTKMALFLALIISMVLGITLFLQGDLTNYLIHIGLLKINLNPEALNMYFTLIVFVTISSKVIYKKINHLLDLFLVAMMAILIGVVFLYHNVIPDGAQKKYEQLHLSFISKIISHEISDLEKSCNSLQLLCVFYNDKNQVEIGDQLHLRQFLSKVQTVDPNGNILNYEIEGQRYRVVYAKKKTNGYLRYIADYINVTDFSKYSAMLFYKLVIAALNTWIGFFFFLLLTHKKKNLLTLKEYVYID